MNRHLLISMLTLTFAFLGGIGAFGQDQRLVVWLKDGEKVFFDLEENPKTTFSGSNIIISTSSMTIYYPLEQVLRYTYELPSSSIETINQSKTIHISQSDYNIMFENIKEKSEIIVYSADGKLLSMYKAEGQQSITVSLANYPTGIYIVKFNGVIYKIMKP